MEVIYNKLALDYRLNIRKQDFNSLRELIKLAKNISLKLTKIKEMEMVQNPLIPI